MTELERRALLGDRQAQERLTELRIPLRCPLCGDPVVLMEVEPHSEKIGLIEYKYDGGAFLSCSCGYAISGDDKADVIRKHNARPAPPIGRCKDCASKENATVNAKGFLVCPASGMEITETDFCSYYEPKPPLKELATLQPLDGVMTKEEAGETCVPGTRPNGCHNSKNHEQTAKAGVLVCTLLGVRTNDEFCCTGWEPKGGEENG